ncbi:MAG: hypothetical protein IIC39_00165 [Candidatus Marinimicrobia bacterium]|nr:hypothetical protein [Candidatus Neomarinimicrobiota bacterium]TFB09603.1 hypothetical protein E3V36_06345 [Candidatus Marinimicrobia bacterium MT.SAG.2]
MSEFTDKLGIKPGQTVAVIDSDNKLFRKLSLEAPQGVTLQKRILGSKVDMILVRLWEPTNYRHLFQRLQNAITNDGSIWAVIPKKPTALAKGIGVFRDELVEEVLKTDLVDNKTLSITEEEYGIRFVIRRDQRK